MPTIYFIPQRCRQCKSDKRMEIRLSRSGPLTLDAYKGYPSWKLYPYKFAKRIQ